MGIWPNASWYVAVLNLDAYRSAAARADPAMSYFAKLGPIDPLRASRMTLSEPADHQAEEMMLTSAVDAASVRRWLEATPENRAVVTDLLAELVGISGLLVGREDEALDALTTFLGPAIWDSLGPQLPAAAAHHRVWHERRQGLTEFREHLAANDWAEANWQAFFERNAWIFGFGLDYQFLHLVVGRPYVGGKSFSGDGGLFGDYLMATGGTLRFTVLVEIKRPDVPLVRESPYRNRVFEIGPDVAGGIGQLHRQVSQWVSEAGTNESRDPLERINIFTHEPRAILVVGRTSDFRDADADGVDRDELYAFESLRRNLHQPEIITFDELYARAEQSLSSQPGGPLSTIRRI